MSRRALALVTLLLLVRCVPAPLDVAAYRADTAPDGLPDVSLSDTDAEAEAGVEKDTSLDAGDALDTPPDIPTEIPVEVTDADAPPESVDAPDTDDAADTADAMDLDDGICCTLASCQELLGDLGPCAEASCDEGSCLCEARFLVGACDDGDDCTYDDVCSAGACEGTTSSCDDELSCTVDICLEEGACANEIDDGHCLISEDDGPASCHAEDETHEDNDCLSCRPSLDPTSWTPRVGYMCDDGDPCTVNDHCDEEGVCAGQGLGSLCTCDMDADCLPLDDGDLCNGILRCDGDEGKCVVDPDSTVVCPADLGTSCLESACNSLSGLCDPVAVNEGGACDDASACTSYDVCISGTCAGVPTPISDGLSCTEDDCDDVSGEVSHALQADYCLVSDAAGAKCITDLFVNPDNPCQICDIEQSTEGWSPDDDKPCDDGDPTTANDYCVAGACVGVEDSDGDGVVDTLDNCVEVVNPSQLDADGDEQGDLCDPDDDQDGVEDGDDCAPFDPDVYPGAVEVCDELDNDCDAASDAGDVELELPPCEHQLGECQGSLKPASLCEGGAWKPCGAAAYAIVGVSYEAGTERSCDGLDNDCDGETDEGFAYQGAALGEACDGQGSCGDGVVECTADGAGTTCSTNPDGSSGQGGVETCNGLDDDCDGLIDEDWDPAASSCTFAGLCNPGNVVVGCVAGAWTCSYDTVPGYNEGAELLCDGQDNDCDGLTDEDFSWQAPDGSQKVKGDACGHGGCMGGTVICAEEGDALACSSDVGGGKELCDGVDNDCDGETDEGLTYDDPVSGEPLTLGEDCHGLGICAEGVVECGDDGAITCSTNADGSESQAVDETCNGLDDDCDGELDEGITWQGSTVGGPCDGTGECGAGTVICAEAGVATCSTNPDGDAPEAQNEGCDGLDNDCDGLTDDGLTVSDSDCRLTGVCTTHNVAATCDGAAGWSCDYSGVELYAEDELGRCDGLDNDCDGLTDEDTSYHGLALGGELRRGRRGHLPQGRRDLRRRRRGRGLRGRSAQRGGLQWDRRRLRRPHRRARRRGLCALLPRRRRRRLRRRERPVPLRPGPGQRLHRRRQRRLRRR
jgi:hypothetical protein